MVSWRPASAANLAFFKWFGVYQPSFLLSITTVVRRHRPTGDRAPGRIRSSLRVVVDRTRENLRPLKFACAVDPDEKLEATEATGHPLSGNDPLTSGRLIAGPRGSP